MSKLLDALKRAEQLRKQKLAQENVPAAVASNGGSNPEVESAKQAELDVIQAHKEAEAAEREKAAEMRRREADELALAKLAADRIAAEEAATAAAAERMRAQAALDVATADRAVVEAKAAKAIEARNKLEHELNAILAEAETVRRDVAAEARDLEKSNEAREAGLRAEITKVTAQLAAIRADAAGARDKANADAVARRAALERDIKKINAELADVTGQLQREQSEREQLNQQTEKLHESELSSLRERLEAEKKAADTAATAHASAHAALAKLFTEKKTALADLAKREEEREQEESAAASATNAKLEAEKALVEATRQKVAAAERASALAKQQAEAARLAEKEAKRTAEVQRAEAVSQESLIATMDTPERNPLIGMKMPAKKVAENSKSNWAKLLPALAATTALGVLLGTQVPRDNPPRDVTAVQASKPTTMRTDIASNAEPVKLRLDVELRTAPKSSQKN